MSEQNSQLMGVNLNKVISSTFFIAGLMTGAAAFFYTTVYESTKFNVGFELGLAAFTAAVLGGIGNIRGAFFAGDLRSNNFRYSMEGSNRLRGSCSCTSLQAKWLIR
jgi:branched-subunit amino acid ABC-type transport system permease component